MKHLTLDFGLGHDFRVVRLSPVSGSMLRMEPAKVSLSPSPSASAPAPLLSLVLSLSLKITPDVDKKMEIDLPAAIKE